MAKRWRVKGSLGRRPEQGRQVPGFSPSHKMGIAVALALAGKGDRMGEMQRLVAAVAYATAESYVRTCAAAPGGLAARIHRDIFPGAPATAAEVTRYWDDIFPSGSQLMGDPGVATGFVDVVCDIWREWLKFSNR